MALHVNVNNYSIALIIEFWEESVNSFNFELNAIIIFFFFSVVKFLAKITRWFSTTRLTGVHNHRLFALLTVSSSLTKAFNPNFIHHSLFTLPLYSKLFYPTNHLRDFKHEWNLWTNFTFIHNFIYFCTIVFSLFRLFFLAILERDSKILNYKREYFTIKS